MPMSRREAIATRAPVGVLKLAYAFEQATRHGHRRRAL